MWDLSDQDGDGHLSLRELCVAVYLIQQVRAGRPLPPALPAGILPDSLAGAPGEGAGASGAGQALAGAAGQVIAPAAGMTPAAAGAAGGGGGGGAGAGGVAGANAAATAGAAAGAGGVSSSATQQQQSAQAAQLSQQQQQQQQQQLQMQELMKRRASQQVLVTAVGQMPVAADASDIATAPPMYRSQVRKRGEGDVVLKHRKGTKWQHLMPSLSVSSD